MKYFLGMVSLIVLSQHSLQAQSQISVADMQSDTVLIESSRMGLTANQTGKFVTVLTQQDIELLPARSLDELLRFVPGIEIQARGPFGTQADFSMRGGTFNQVLVLMDGMRINDPLTGHFQTYLPVLPEEILRIEVLRGPSSAQYGPDAVGGVINIVTKMFEPAYANSERSQISADILTGQHQTYGLSGALGGNTDRIRGFISGRNLSSEGHPLASGETSDFVMTTGSGSAGIDLGQGWDLALRTGYDRRTFQAQYYYTVSPFDESREQTSRWWNQARLTKRSAQRETRLDVTYLASRDSFLFNPAFSANVHQMGFLNANLHHVESFTQSFSLAGGVQASSRSIESNDRGDHRDAHLGAYIMGNGRLGDALYITGSIRADQDQNYGLEFSPQLNIAFLKPSYTLRAGIGKAIRAADYTERYISTQITSLSPGRNLGNPDLEAERSWNYELGADLRFTSSLTASLTGFLRQGNNLIDYVPTPSELIPNNEALSPNATYLYASNLSALNTYGLEAMIAWNQTIADKYRLRAEAGYSLLRNNDSNTISKYLANTARQQISVRASVSHQKFQAGIQGLYRERDEENAAAIGADISPSFMIWHARFGTRILDGRVLIQANIYNLLNETYADLLGADMPGRWWTIGAGIRL